MQKVAIVKAGEWRGLRQGHGDYDGLVKMLGELLKKAKCDSKPAAQVRVVQDTEEALIGGTDVIVYIAYGMLHEAKKVAAEHHDIRVVLVTDLLPKGEVVFVKKGCAPTAYIKDVVLGG